MAISFNPGWTHVEDEEIWLDVPNAAHVCPEVWATAGTQGCIGSLVELFWGFVAGGINLVCLEGSSLGNSFNRGFKWNAPIGETFATDAG